MQERQLHRSQRARLSALEPIARAGEEARHKEDQVGKGDPIGQQELS